MDTHDKAAMLIQTIEERSSVVQRSVSIHILCKYAPLNNVDMF